MHQPKIRVADEVTSEPTPNSQLESGRNQLKTYFDLVRSEISKTGRKNAGRYWDLVGMMQELANRGSYSARNYMLGIDLSKAPKHGSYQSNLARLESGAPTVSVRGARRQLLTDPNSPNRTYLSSGSIEV
jgi:hypothetical protein